MRNIVGVSLLGMVGFATAVAEEEADFAAVEAKLRDLAPSAETVALSETPISGLLQAQINNEIYYISRDGKFLVQGQITDLDTRTNITNQAKSTIRKDIIKDIDVESQITFSPETPEYELMVFTDIDCGYCRKLHDQIKEYNEAGIAIHYLAFPRAGVDSHSYEKFVSVWCADDQQEALTLAKSGSEPDPLQCENPIQDQYELGLQLGVTGTPALLTAEGDLIPGYMPPEQLKSRLASIKSASAP